MVTPTHTPYLGLALGDVMRAGLKQQQSAQSTPQGTDSKAQTASNSPASTQNSFGSELDRVIAEPARYWVDGTPANDAARQNVDTATRNSPKTESAPAAMSLNGSGLIHVLRADEVPAGTMDRLPPISSDTQNHSFSEYEDPTPAVLDELQKMGVSTTGMSFTRYDDQIGNWGGSYTNHLLRVQMANGRQEDFSIEWTLRSPQVTAVEIQRLMNLSGKLT